MSGTLRGAGALALAIAFVRGASAQGCSNRCPPLDNNGDPVASLCVGDEAIYGMPSSDLSVCHPPGRRSVRLSEFIGGDRNDGDPSWLLVVSNYYIGCNAGMREANVYAYASKLIHARYPNVVFLSGLKGGTAGQCTSWAKKYEDAGALDIPAEYDTVAQPIVVDDSAFLLRDAFFTAPYPHPSYVILDSAGRVRDKFVGPCCGYEDYKDCSVSTASVLNGTLHDKITPLLEEIALQSNGNADCSLSDWADWSTCRCASSSDNMGTTTRGRTVTQNAIGSGACRARMETKPCSCVVQVDWELADWSEWSNCSMACGKGQRYRTRDVVVQASNDRELPILAEAEECIEAVCRQQCVPMLGKSLDVRAIATAKDGLSSPRDVAFAPLPGRHLGNFSSGRSFSTSGEEAWVANGHNHSITIVTGVGEEKQQSITRFDRGWYHYMLNITALSFNMDSESGRDARRDTFAYFATCQDNSNTYAGLKEPNFFQGPTLYSSSPEYKHLVRHDGGPCTEADECFFLHSDMLHESPSCPGIVHDPERTTAYGSIYWAIDGVAGHLVRYDFQQPHGPGLMDHSVAAVRRYPEVRITRGFDGLHHGMAIDPEERALYVVNAGSGEILRVWIDTGKYARTAREEYPIFSSQFPSFEYSIYLCVEQEVFASGFSEPSGLALADSMLYVAEHATGNIVVIDLASGFQINVYATGVGAGLMGISFAPTSFRLYGVNAQSDQLLEFTPSALCDEAFVAYRNVDVVPPAMLPRGNVSTCVPDGMIPNASLFVQVHVGTGYDDENVAVQNDTMRDESAALLAYRTDCEPDSDLNFDALLLGGYLCHRCLPDNCRDGGRCTNVWFEGYSCDNEFRVTYHSGSLEAGLWDTGRYAVVGGGFFELDRDEVLLDAGRDYRFVVNARGAPVGIQSSIGAWLDGPIEVGVLKASTAEGLHPAAVSGLSGILFRIGLNWTTSTSSTTSASTQTTSTTSTSSTTSASTQTTSDGQRGVQGRDGGAGDGRVRDEEQRGVQGRDGGAGNGRVRDEEERGVQGRDGGAGDGRVRDEEQRWAHTREGTNQDVARTTSSTSLASRMGAVLLALGMDSCVEDTGVVGDMWLIVNNDVGASAGDSDGGPVSMVDATVKAAIAQGFATTVGVSDVSVFVSISSEGGFERGGDTSALAAMYGVVCLGNDEAMDLVLRVLSSDKSSLASAINVGLPSGRTMDVVNITAVAIPMKETSDENLQNELQIAKTSSHAGSEVAMARRHCSLLMPLFSTMLAFRLWR